MSVEFQFDFPRVLAAVTYIASKKIPDLTMYKILKILFLADKNHLVRYGRTLTGDKYCALPDGPVPSRVYDLFKKQVLKKPFTKEGEQIVANLSINKAKQYPEFQARTPFDADELSKSDIEALDYAIKELRSLDYDQIKRLTHKIPAYDRVWKARPKGRDSVPMKVEDLFEGDPNEVPGSKEEMFDNDKLSKCLSKR